MPYPAVMVCEPVTMITVLASRAVILAIYQGEPCRNGKCAEMESGWSDSKVEVSVYADPALSDFALVPRSAFFAWVSVHSRDKFVIACEWT